ncbi:MAG TPA: hypothetical protein VNY77_04915 [Candidatus Angelobacter sp.]|jgi:hypothetical protein|nr:hypothetical protein [Candidatus Angelobacter sp.]
MKKESAMHINWKKTTLAFGIPVFMAALAPTAYASTPTPMSGAFNATIAPVASHSDGGNTFISFTFTEAFTGTMSGTRVGTGTLVVHPDGTLNVLDTGLLTGSIAGATGTATITGVGSGVFGSFMGRFRVSDAAGGLSGVRGEGSFTGSATGPVSFAGTYTGQIQSS